MKVISNLLLVISVLALLWVGLSWLEVIVFNLGSDHVYCKFNIFELMVRKAL